MPKGKSKKSKTTKKPVTKDKPKEISNVEENNCQLCNEVDNDRMVMCDICDLWHHYDCVNLTTMTESTPWECPTCKDLLRTVLTVTTSDELAKGEIQQRVAQVINESKSGQQICGSVTQVNEQSHVRRRSDIGIDYPNIQKSLDHQRNSTMRDRQQVQTEFYNPFQQETSTQNRIQSTLVHGHQVRDDNQRRERQLNVEAFQQSLYRTCSPIRSSHSRDGQSTKGRRDSRDSRGGQSTNDWGQGQFVQYDGRYGTIPQRYERNFIYNRPQESCSYSGDKYYRSHSFSERISSDVYSRRRTQIELNRIEEEKYLQEKRHREKILHDQQYLDKKYRLLRDECESERRSDVDRSIYTQNWVEDSFSRNTKGSHGKSDPKFKRETDIPDSVPIIPKRLTHHSPTLLNLKQEQFTSKTIGPKFTSGDNRSKSHKHQSPQDLNVQPLMGNHAGDNWNTPLPSGTVPSGHVLTRAQIAARQVVSKDLKPYSGSPEEWEMFYKRFTESTKLCGYSNGENLDRLSKCLKGVAHDAVKNLLLDSESVPDIINTLKLLFGRPELIIKYLMKKIRKQPTPKADNLNSMVTFALEVKNLAKSMQRQELTRYLSNPALIQELVDKIPTFHKVDWAKYVMHISEENVTLLTLSQWLDDLMKALVRVTEITITKPPDTKPPDKKSDKKTNKSEFEHVNIHQEENMKESNLKAVSNDSTIKSETKGQCSICDKSYHKLEDCEKFKSYQLPQRWKTIMEKGLCRNCLRPHRGFCKLNKRCGVNDCTYKHHSLLHDDQRHNKNTYSQRVIGKTADISGSHLSFYEKVILRIVPIKLYENGCSIDTFAFLDDGSTTTLMDQRIADALKLNGTKMNLCLMWSGKVHRMEKNSRRVEVAISSLEDTQNRFKLRGVKTVELLGIPAQTLNRDDLYERFPYLQNVPFTSYENGVPGILIGSNNPKIGLPEKIVEGGEYQPKLELDGLYMDLVM